MPTITIDNRAFYCEVKGRGEPILFISGMGGDHTAWGFQIPSHSRHFTCISFDNRGTGKSARAADGMDTKDYTVELLADDAAAILDALDIPAAHIVGASMGGAVAQAFALRHPERMLSLSLHSTFARVNGKMRARFENEVFLVGKLEVGEVLMSLAHMIWAERTFTERFHVIEAFRSARKKTGVPISREVFRLQGEAILHVDYLPRLGEIRVPVLVTTGDDDGLIPPEESRLIHRAIPGSSLHVFRDCGHAVTMENRRGFNTVSLRFLKRCSGSLG